MSKITKITAFFLFFVICICVNNAYAATYSTKAECEANCSGTCSGTIRLGFFCTESTITPGGGTQITPGIGVVTPKTSCSSTGETQSKYTADVEACDYETKTRECCSDGYWSGWDEECEEPCTSCPWSSQPPLMQSCTLSNGKTGTQTRTVECNLSTCTWKTPSAWGECKCNVSCSSGQVRDNNNCQCCSYGCYFISGSAVNAGSNINMTCDCKFSSSFGSSTGTCCSTTIAKFRLPSGYSSCSEFAADAGLTLASYNPEYSC